MKSNLRIVQLIDSLDAGGAERMAVNYANSLGGIISFSALVTTRKEGALKAQLSEEVGYLFLDKKGKLGLKAVFKLRKFIIENGITIIHAHSSSFFTAVLVKLSYPKVKIIWHDHYGNSEFLMQRGSLALRTMAVFFHGIISVNVKLKDWAVEHLKFKNASYLPNFVFFTEVNKKLQQTRLSGNDGKRIVCLANLREQKNHLMLLDVAGRLKESHGDWTFHLIGKDFEDEYSRLIHQEIFDRSLTKHVFIYGSKNDVGSILNQSDIAILTSKSEGLPVALLEYGFYSKAVLSTRVGEIATVIASTKTGALVPSEDCTAFYKELVKLIADDSYRAFIAANLKQHVEAHYSEKAVIYAYLNWVEKL